MSKQTFNVHSWSLLAVALFDGGVPSGLQKKGEVSFEGKARVTRLSPAREKRAISGFVPGGRRGLHGMIVFGSRSSGFFFSHIPMFHSPHDAQAVFPTEIEGAPFDLSDSLYTFKPDDADMSLDDVVLGLHPQIQGTLFRGNFEQSEKPIGKVIARVRSPLKPLTQSVGASDLIGLTYVAFGEPEAAYLIHRLGRAPDFDQVIRCDLRDTGITAEMLSNGVTLTIAEKANRLEERLRVGKHQARLDDGTRVVFTVEAVLSTLLGPEFTESPAP